MGGNRSGAEGSESDLPEMIDTTILRRLSDTIAARKQADPASSYVAGLFGKGHTAILKKVAEESAETLLASKDGDKLHVVRETADLWFHCLVLLAVSYTHLRAHETRHDLVCRLLLEKKKQC